MSGAGMTRLTSRGAAAGRRAAVEPDDAVIELVPDTDPPVIEVVTDDAPLLEVVEPVVVGADSLNVALDDLSDVVIPDGLPEDVPLALVRGPDGRFVLAVTDESTRNGVGYRHVQLVATRLWLVPHGLAFYPGGISVYDDEGYRTEPDEVRHPQLGIAEIIFGAPVKGYADLS